MPKYYAHHRGLRDANVLRTPDLDAIGASIRDIVGCQGIGVVHGEAGRGKTFGVGAHLTILAKEVQVARTVMTKRPNERMVLCTVLKAVAGIDAGSDTTYELFEETARELGRRPRVLVIDEAQNLSKLSIETVRHLHDDERTNFALLLVGGDGCWDVLSNHPMLRSRVDHRVHVRALGDEQVLRFIPQYHPVYDGVDAELLLLINERWAHGNFRRWASFTRKASALCESVGSALTEEVVRNVFSTDSGQSR